MEHAVTRPAAPFWTRNKQLRIHQLPAWQDNLIWLIEFDGQAAVVDGPPVAEQVLAYCAEHDLKLTAILNTHTHGDHVGINRDLAKRGALDGVRVYGPKRAAGQVPGITDPVDEGDSITLGECTGRVLLTEGHINGHVSYLFDDALFCGDTLFGGGCGYLFDGPPSTMHASLERLAELPDHTWVCCAHEYTQDNLRFAWSIDPDNQELVSRIRYTWDIRGIGGSSVPSTIALERDTNPFLRHHSDSLRRRVAAAMPDRDLASPASIFAATRALKDRKDYKQITDAELPLLVRNAVRNA